MNEVRPISVEVGFSAELTDLPVYQEQAKFLTPVLLGAVGDEQILDGRHRGI